MRTGLSLLPRSRYHDARPAYLSPAAMRSLLSLSLLAVLAACGDLDVRSVREQPPGVPAELFGEWQGTWQSSSSGATGVVIVQVQEFAGEPIVGVQFQNPCLEPRSYDLVVTPATIELRADGRTVLAATLGEGRELVGIYTCSSEDGTWSATWRRELPELLDLGGTWSGTVVFTDQVARPFTMELVQRVDGGAVEIDGTIDLGDLWPVPVVVSGGAIFRQTGFDLGLHTVAGSSPTVVLSGAGDLDPLRIETGLLHVLEQALPFPLGVFSVQRQGP